jgi:S1-C subfamily serine protease
VSVRAATTQVILCLMGLVAGAHAAQAASLDNLRQSVFKIQTTASEPSFIEPWKRQPSQQSSGTGFYIGNRRIMTNAHVVANATYLTVLRDGASKPVPAYVQFIAHDADLAILTTEDKDFFDDVRPMTFGRLPRLRSPVMTIGFPTGGEQLSITEGIVSRVSYRRYVHHGEASHLLVQVDSAINPGNSGGPVVQGRKVVGVAFQTFTRAENTGYIIPTVVVDRFLKDIEDGTYDEHPKDGLTLSPWTTLNAGNAAYHGLSEADGGVQIAHVADWAPTAGKLKAGDIVLAIDNQPIGVDGKLDFQGERVDFRGVYDLKQIGDTAVFKVARAGQRLAVEVPVTVARSHHRPDHVYAQHARFFVYGGLVFTTLSRSYLRTWGDRWFRDAPLLLRYLDFYAPYEAEMAKTADVIVLAKRLPDTVNAYATSNMFGVVRSVDGNTVESLPELISALENGTGTYAIISFMGSNDPIVLERAAVKGRNAAINAKYGVVPDRWLAGPEVDGALTKPKGGGT